MRDRTRLSLTLLLGGVLVLGTSARAAADDARGLPAGWFVTESTPQLYASGLDTEGPCEGGRSAWLRSTRDTATGYGTFMQAFDARAFRGKRLRFSAVVRTEDVKGWTGLWMRVEGEDPQQALAFDNMQSRAIRGTTSCKRQEVVLDVAPEARAIMAGLMLSGTGKAWMGAVRIEPVEDSVPTTNLLAGRQPVSGGSGSVGRFWFSPERADAPRGRYVRQPDGSWKNGVLEDVLTVEPGAAGVTVKGEFDDRPLRVTVRTGGTTRIEGTWGEDPVSIELTGEHLVLTRGINHRELKREEGLLLDAGRCVRYRSGTGLFTGDSVRLCGLALHRNPPEVPLVIALLANGFRAQY